MCFDMSYGVHECLHDAVADVLRAMYDANEGKLTGGSCNWMAAATDSGQWTTQDAVFLSWLIGVVLVAISRCRLPGRGPTWKHENRWMALQRSCKHLRPLDPEPDPVVLDSRNC